MSAMNDSERQSVAPSDVRRAPRSVNGIQRTSLRVHLTISERALLEAKARNRGWSLSRTLVHSALHPTSAEDIDSDNLAEVITDLRDYRRKLAGMANNLNQLTRYAHSKQELPKQIEDVLGQVERSVDEINYLLASVRR
ncbi:MAG: MobC family plasmid mobilization relaxosome protein [Actinomycetaceae bacterium]|nr:MobC family plasmid mobilization relaxosome protein [Actinomycetaceae bacterium]